jgi:uncharacterized protein YjbI with pentapeptide repeats
MDITNKITGETILSVDSLSNADLSYANLWNADLNFSDLMGADLSNANLSNTNLMGTNLSYADLSNTNLMGTNLSYANLRNADLSNANLWNTIGNRREIKTIQTETYNINYTKNIIQIGCENHTIKDWFNFSDKEIIEMDGKQALVWWRKWKPILQEIIND